MKTVDARGLLCPAPLILTKKAIDSAQQGDALEVLIDNETSLSNVLSYLNELQIIPIKENADELFTLRFTKPAELKQGVEATDFCFAPTAYVVVIKSETMGEGSNELGTLLMRAFVNSLKEVERLPSAIILYNGGVKLGIKETDTAQSLAELEKQGVGIVACGTCVDYYGLKNEMAVGAISNMYKITKLVSEAGHVVYP